MAWLSGAWQRPVRRVWRGKAEFSEVCLGQSGYGEAGPGETPLPKARCGFPWSGQAGFGTTVARPGETWLPRTWFGEAVLDRLD